MSGIPPLPPLRVKESDGSPNVIPVFVMELSNITLTNLGGGKVLLDGAGGTGPAGPAGTLTIGSGISGGAVDGYLLMVSNGATLGQIDSSTFQRAIAFPLSIASGGTARTTAGSAHTLLGVNSDGTTLSYYAILASNNTTVTKVGTAIFISANSASLSGKQDNITFPLILTSGGTGIATAGSGTMFVGMNSSGVVYDYYNLLASDNIVITREGTGYFIRSTASGGGGNGVVNPGSAGNLAQYVISGTAVDDLLIGSAGTLVGVNSSGASHQYLHIKASDNATVVFSGTAIFISALTNAVGAGGGSGTVNPGSAGNLAYYAAAGTAVDDLLIGSATLLLGVNSSGASHEYFALLGSNNTSVIYSGTSYTFSTLTNNIAGKQDSITFPLITGSGGTGRSTVGSAHTLLGVNSDGSTLTYYAILASDNATVTKSGTSILISATTADISGKQASISFPLIVGSGGIGTDNLLVHGILYGSGATKIQSFTVMSHGALLVGSGAGSPGMFLSSGAIGTILTSTGGTASGLAWVNSSAGGGSGTVNTGSQNYLAYYPSAGTTIDDVSISVSTAAGIAPFNVQILTSAPTSIASGDLWFQSSSNRLYLGFRSSLISYYVELGS